MRTRVALASQDRQVHFLWRRLIWGVGLVPLIVTPFWPRSFYLDSYRAALEVEFGPARFIAQLATLTMLMLAIRPLLYGLYVRSGPLKVRGLWLGVLLLALGPLLSTFLGISPQFSGGHLTLPLLFSAIAFLPPVPVEWLVGEAKRLSMVYILGSLLAAVVVPSWALEIPYTQGYIPGLDVRLHGVTVHAIQTALFAMLFMLFEVAFPTKQGWPHWLSLVTSFVVLVLTQSKTAWVLVLLGLGLMYIMEMVHSPSLTRLSGFFIGAAVASGGALLVATGALNPGNTLTQLFAERTEDLSTLTGRTRIWAVVLELVRENPLFGYGPHLWDPEMTLTYARVIGWVPAQSHNQYIQSLGEGGLIGLAGLIVYGLILLRTGWVYRSVGHGLPFVLPLLWFIRGFTESWYRKATTDGNLVIHMLIFAFLVVLAGMGETTNETLGVSVRSSSGFHSPRGGRFGPAGARAGSDAGI